MAERKKGAKKVATEKAKSRPAAKRAASPVGGKSTSKKKTPAKKPASPAARRKAATKRPPTPRAGDSKRQSKGSKSVSPPVPQNDITVAAVSLGHVMALRPRIHVGFKPSAFMDAKRALVDSRYASIEEAARAVARKAIEISNDSPLPDPFARR